MRKKWQLINQRQEKDFESFEEELSLVELNNEELSFIYNKLNEAKRYVVTEHTGLKHITEDIKELKKILESSNIKEIVIEELSSGNAKKQSIKIENSPSHKKTIKRSQLELVKSTSVSNIPLALKYEKILNLDLQEIEKSIPIKKMFKGISMVKAIDESLNVKTKEKIDGVVINKEKNETLLLSKKKVTKSHESLNKNFFKIKNNSELFKVGKSFMNDFDQGKRCFGFSSNGNNEEMINTLYGISSFFNYYNHTTVLMFVSDVELNGLRKISSFGEAHNIQDEVLGLDYDIYKTDELSIVSYSSLLKKHKSKAYDLVDKLTKQSGVSLCSLPEINEIDQNIDLYFQILQRIDNISLIIKKNNTKVNDVQKLMESLKNYKVDIKGVLIG